MHTTKGYVPVDIAKALLANPSLVQKAVEAFYTRDAIQLRVSTRQSKSAVSWRLLSSYRPYTVCLASHRARMFYGLSR